MNILVIRFRQMGDAILATALLNTLRYNFPDAHIHFVLNEKIVPLFYGHPAIDKLIAFNDEERHNVFTYIRKVRHIVHVTRYDIIIDMRSTVNTMLFAMFSHHTKYRIGVDKGYTKIAFNHLVDTCGTKYSMVEYDVHYTDPLNVLKKIVPINEFTLHITEEEKQKFGTYLLSQGIDITKPIMLANVTAKLASKVWNEDRMIWVLNRFIQKYPDYCIIFNYAPGQEEVNARRIYENLGNPKQVFINVKARSSRELVALGGFVTFFFGNEGGARHIMHATGCPSLVICAPGNNKKVWIPHNSILAEGISPSDMTSEELLTGMSGEDQYRLITQEFVWQKLQEFMVRLNN